MRTISLFGLLAVTLTLAGCGGDDDAADPANTSTGIEIDGSWTSSFGGTEVIHDASWTTEFGTVAITDYSNSENVAITQNAADDAFSPNTFNRVVWTEISGGSFYNCTTDFGLETEAEAQAATTVPDVTDPDTTGCGGNNPWTKLTKQ